MHRLADTCDIFCFDEEKVTRVKTRLTETDCAGLARWFKALADETRLKIARALGIEKELCVCDVANIIGSSVATASHHLRLLRHLGIARHRKEGKLVFYSLADRRFALMLQAAEELQKGEAIHGPAR